jgi:hypothetical protein
VCSLGWNNARCHQQANRNGDIKTGPAATFSRTSQVDGDTPVRPFETTRQHGSTHSVARFATSFVGQTHHGECWYAGPNMRFHNNA